MNTSTHTVKQHIEEIGCALLFNTGNDVLKMPTQLVQTIKADEYGQIWTLVPRPLQQIEQFHPHFPARLHYYKKGAPIALQVYGKATIITDPETISVFRLDAGEANNHHFEEMMLVHIQLQHVEVFDLTPKHVYSRAGVWEWIKTQLQWVAGRRKTVYKHEWVVAGESGELAYMG